jgi:hypothetical protein
VRCAGLYLESGGCAIKKVIKKVFGFPATGRVVNSGRIWVLGHFQICKRRDKIQWNGLPVPGRVPVRRAEVFSSDAVFPTKEEQMGDKGSKDKGGHEQKKKAKLTLKEKRKQKQDKKNNLTVTTI